MQMLITLHIKRLIQKNKTNKQKRKNKRRKIQTKIKQ